MGETVIYERTGTIGIIKLNRPEVLNAVNGQLIEDFIEALKKAKEDREARVLILKGEGRAFCAGADIKEGVVERSIEEYRERVLKLQGIGRLFLELDKPVIGAIHGYALGAGCEFALNCDIRLAAEGTQFGFPETSVGATVTTAGTKSLPAVIGLGKAFEFLFTGERIEARKGEQMGLVNRVVPLEELEKTAIELAERIAKNYPLALALTRRSVYRGLGASLEDVLMEEAEAACISFASGERKTGMKAARK